MKNRKFKVGKKYKTVSGLTVKITEIDNDPYYPIYGQFVKSKIRDYWSKSGCVNLEASSLDLVAKKKRFTKKDVKRAYDKGYKDAREIVIAANRLVGNNDMDLETYLRQGLVPSTKRFGKLGGWLEGE
jgi:hypothetical protein